jgi:hypothetical protein
LPDPRRIGDEDGEYWKLTTSDGTQYFFGRNRVESERTRRRRDECHGPEQE